MKREARRMLADFRLKEFAVESETKNIFFFLFLQVIYLKN